MDLAGRLLRTLMTSTLDSGQLHTRGAAPHDQRGDFVIVTLFRNSTISLGVDPGIWFIPPEVRQLVGNVLFVLG